MNARVSTPEIFRRGNRWYIRVQVPKHMQDALRRKEKWISLKTSDRNEAIRRAPSATSEQRWLDERVYRMKLGLRHPIETFEPEQLLALGREAYKMLIEQDDDPQKAFQESGQKGYADFVRVQKEALENMANIFHAQGGHHPLIEQMMLVLCERNAIHVPKGSIAESQLRRICMDVSIDGNRRKVARLQSQEVPVGADPRFVDPNTGDLKAYTRLEDQLRNPPPPEPKLSELVERFLNDPNKSRAEKTKKTVQGYLNVVVELLGNDTPVHMITNVDCERVRDTIMQLPPNFAKLRPLRNKPIEEMVGIAKRKNMPKLSPTGVNNYLLWFCAFLNWCVRKNLISKMPISFDDLKIADPVRKQDKRASFSDEQLTTIFHSREFLEQERTSALFWVTLIALWNGMRSNEICQLDAADVKCVENVWGFDITNISATGNSGKHTKTDSSIRFIPIHERLLEFGLLDFHSKRPANAKLFGDITVGADGYYSTNFSKKSNRLLKKIGVHGPRHKFHSFRHTFRDAIRRGRVDREIGKALGGWKSDNTDAFDIYGSGFLLEELADELKRVDYPKVNWDHLIIES